MMKFVSRYGVFVLTVLCLNCSRQHPQTSDLINAVRRTVSPVAINIGGIKLDQSNGDVRSIFPLMQCESKGNSIDICRWRTTAEDRKGPFKGIYQLILTFYHDTLQTIEVHYAEMFDAEYVDFDRNVREKYGYAIAGKIIDSTGTEWQYDSLKVLLIPNKKRHWTGSAFVFTPVLSFQERMIYSRWLTEVEQRKPNAPF